LTARLLHFFDELVRLMAGAYAKATDTAMVTALQAGTLDSTVITLPFDGDEFAGYISRGAASTTTLQSASQLELS